MDRFFDTPARERPDIDLGLSAVPFMLSTRQRDIDSGVTRFFDAVMGRALDGAGEQDLEPSDITAALAAGELTVRTFFFQYARAHGLPVSDLHDDEASLVGTIEANEDQLFVSGGGPTVMPSAMMYHKRNDMYVPFAAQVVHETAPGTVRTVMVPEPYIYELQDEPGRKLPAELRVAQSLGALADIAYFNLDMGLMTTRGRVEYIR